MRTIRGVDSRTLIKILEGDGWVRVAVKGSHHQFKHPEKPGRVTVPHPKKDLKQGTERAILKQAGLS
ncbi:MAG: type II toxin-antitoxin system HicA family toxin [Geothrix sp.]|nr:type II toxin-antitoxin system HicA family toxin [Geothrix sp.]